MHLPVTEAIPDLTRALHDGRNAVLVAPPGAGKTTLVPPALLDASWLQGRKIVMLEPRRLAARAAAHRMAVLRGEQVGAAVGYRVRRDTKVSRHTRIEVVTEGVLTRMLNTDPTLEDVALVIFDEFHERSIHADLGLALTLQTQRLVRDDLRILVMSATLAGERVAELLGNAPIIRSEGRTWPVEVVYVPRRDDLRLEGAVEGVVRRAVRETTGDILTFLPGQGEIHRVADALRGTLGDTELHLLFGNLSFADQDRALAPSSRRKVILATSIAESSLTIDGVRVVVDAGLTRSARFSPRSGMERLETVRVSRASADQRAGRAGRQGAGVCYRLWSEGEHAALRDFTSPEILDADLLPLALELAAAGVNADELTWLDAPPAGPLRQAGEVLLWLDAVSSANVISAHGRELASLGTHPRLGHLLLRASGNAERALACDLAALLEERDVLSGENQRHDADLVVRAELVRDVRRGRSLPERLGEMWVRRDAVRRVVEGARQWRRDLSVPAAADWGGEESVGRLLALAFPDRVGQRRPESSRFLLRNGTGVSFRDSPQLAQEDWIVVAETDGRSPEAGVYLAAALSEGDLRADFASQILSDDLVTWDDASARVLAVRRESLGALRLHEASLAHPDPALVLEAVRQNVRRHGLSLLAWSESATRLRERLAFMHHHRPEWPDVSDAGLLQSMDEWLTPSLDGIRSRAHLERLDIGTLLLSRITWQQRTTLEVLAPTHFVAPTGSRLPIDYSDPSAPAVHVRLQEMFGLSDTPRVLDGRVLLTLHLLSPAQRPVQVTRDLAGFWRSSYADVKKDMKGRYPRHYWPDDPSVAEPTRRAKPRGT